MVVLGKHGSGEEDNENNNHNSKNMYIYIYCSESANRQMTNKTTKQVKKRKENTANKRRGKESTDNNNKATARIKIPFFSATKQRGGK